MSRALLNTVLFLPALLCLTACGKAETSTSRDGAVQISFEQISANQAWEKLTSSGERPERLAGEGGLQYFMRQVELSDIRRRELGLTFWHDYPNDPRRYKWLALTVRIPPHYAKDIHEWTGNETTINPNTAALNTDALAKWEKVYPDMREAFRNSAEVTDIERRFLWAMEINQTLLRMVEAHTRGDHVDAASVLEKIAIFAEAYPEAFSENDKSSYYSNIGNLIRYVMGHHRAVFGLDEEEGIYGFIERLADTGNKAASSLSKVLLKRRQNANQEKKVDLSEGRQMFMSLPSTVGYQPSTFEGHVAYDHDILVRNQKFREIGRTFWQKYFGQKEKLEWLAITSNGYSVSYDQNFVDKIRGVRTILDEEEVAEWEQAYAALSAEIFNDPQTTNAQRGYFLHKDINGQFRQVKNAWRDNKDKKGLQELLDNIHILYTEYGSHKDHNAHYITVTGPSVHSFTIIRDYKTLGMSDDDLLTFFEPMFSYEDEDLQNLAKAAFNHVELRRTPFEFKAQTLHGEVFDVKDLRGKIVLVDHWNTGCSACIAAMPGIDRTYQKYKDKGFEVVSICYDATERKKRVLRIEEELGLTWPTVDGESQEAFIKKKYGYQGYPQYMLLNRDGTLYAGTGEVAMGRNLPALLDEMLGAEQASKNK
ncbi:MAG: hypothetical protein COA43_08070 [Robiginitomaculum sp.]|nr:MAG: hypothetical protein COA43_08070 [Robiginitomaculum sp.]